MNKEYILLSAIASFEKRLIISICASIFMSADKDLSPMDAILDGVQVYENIKKLGDQQ